MLEAQTTMARDASRWLQGPVAVIGANGHVGTFVQARLTSISNDVRPLGRDEDLAVAFVEADAVVHLAGTLQAIDGNTYENANVETVRRTIAALNGSSVKRVVFLSYVGADPGSRNDYLRTKGEAERLLAQCGLEVVVLRSTFIVGPPDNPGPSAIPLISRDSKPVSVIGTGRQRYAPVYVEDVADAVVRCALDPTIRPGTYSLAGPDTFTVDELADTLSGENVTERHLGPRLARALAHVMPSLTPTMVDVLAADSLPEAGLPLAADVLGQDSRHIATVYEQGTVEA
jgi:NADH dehydrogenase